MMFWALSPAPTQNDSDLIIYLVACERLNLLSPPHPGTPNRISRLTLTPQNLTVRVYVTAHTMRPADYMF